MNDQTLLAIQTSVSEAINNLRNDVKDELKSIRKEMKDDVNTIKNDIASINTDVSNINLKLNEDYKAIHGNGKKGLLDRVANLENLVSSGGYIYRTIIAFVAWVCATGIAVYAAVIK